MLLPKNGSWILTCLQTSTLANSSSSQLVCDLRPTPSRGPHGPPLEKGQGASQPQHPSTLGPLPELVGGCSLTPGSVRYFWRWKRNASQSPPSPWPGNMLRRRQLGSLWSKFHSRRGLAKENKPKNRALKVSIFDKFQDDKLFTQVWEPSPCTLLSFLSLPPLSKFFPPRALTGVPREGVAG